jgi:outer membrane protein insertion porin family
MKKSLLAVLLLASAVSAWAFDPFTVKDIRIEGIQRIEAGTVFSYLPVKVGEQMTDEKATESVKALFATGFFKDVRVEPREGILVVVVEERPAIAAIEFSGIKAFNKDDLTKSLRSIGLAESLIFDRAMLDRAEQELKRQYLGMGFYDAIIRTSVSPQERNRVSIHFTVDEGDKAKIRKINILGTKAFSEDELLDQFVLTTPGFFTWYTKNDQYSKQKLSADLENLKSFYLDQGFLEFTIESTQVSISPDRQGIYITIGLSEGERYTVSSVKLAGNLILPDEDIRKLVTVFPGDVYSRAKLTETTKAISDRLANVGYAFANVNAVPELDKIKHQANFTILVDPGQRVSVRRIDVTGNSRTRDEVIRREIRQMESAWYEGDKINKSRTRVDNLGFFDEVTIETPPVPGVTDQVDVNVKVKEKATGSLMLGAGFSSAEKVTLSASISQDNLFGSGKFTSVQVNTSKYYRTYAFSYTDPYYTIDGVSRGFDLYHRTTQTGGLSLGQYDSKSTGGGVRYGFPLTEDDYIRFGFGLDRTNIKTFDDTPQVWKDYIAQFGSTTDSITTSLGWSRNTIDSRIYPTAGAALSAGVDVGLPGTNNALKYYKVNVNASRYFPVTNRQAIMLSASYGYGAGYGNMPLPFTKNFYAGGIGSVRGYDSYSLGPIDASTGSRLGGDRQILFNAEYLFPMPGMNKDRSVRLGAFFDAGQVWGKGEKMHVQDMRASVGLSLNWSSPIGPLKFSYGNPVNKKDGDKTQRFQFTVGTAF